MSQLRNDVSRSFFARSQPTASRRVFPRSNFSGPKSRAPAGSTKRAAASSFFAAAAAHPYFHCSTRFDAAGVANQRSGICGTLSKYAMRKNVEHSFAVRWEIGQVPRVRHQLPSAAGTGHPQPFVVRPAGAVFCGFGGRFSANREWGRLGIRVGRNDFKERSFQAKKIGKTAGCARTTHPRRRNAGSLPKSRLRRNLGFDAIHGRSRSRMSDLRRKIRD